MLWGACAATREGLADAEEIAHALFKRIRTSYLCQDSLMPRHSLARHRGGLVSFGAVTYYLRAVAEYASTFDDEFALQLFKNGVERVLALQGRQGEWPWMIGVANARCLDFYPVYSVHQDAMAMLFLFPAMEAGVEGCALAVRRSLDWLGGCEPVGAAHVARRSVSHLPLCAAARSMAQAAALCRRHVEYVHRRTLGSGAQRNR